MITKLTSKLKVLSLFKALGTRDLESCIVIALDKSNLLRKVDFLQKSGFQVKAFFILLKVGYLEKGIIIVVNFVYKWV